MGHDTPIPVEAATAEYSPEVATLADLQLRVDTMQADMDAFKEAAARDLQNRLEGFASAIAAKLKVLLQHLEPYHRGITDLVGIDED